MRAFALGVVALGGFAGAAAQLCCFFPAGACGACQEFGALGSENAWCAESAANCASCNGTFCPDGGVGEPAVSPTPSPSPIANPSQIPGTAAPQRAYCCHYSSAMDDVCGACKSISGPGTWCAESEDNCAGACNGTYCAGDGAAGTDAPKTTGATTDATDAPMTTDATDTAMMTVAPPGTPPTAGNWIEGTWTTGYWDCMKPSCSWPGKGAMTAPVRACSATSQGTQTVNAFEPSAADGGDAVSCVDNQPVLVEPGLSFGFAAAAVSGSHGLKGDDNCGECYILKFTDQIHPNGNWGGSHPDLVGHTMVVQVTNIGYDVNGEHSFDLQIPGAGQGLFNYGCTQQFPGFSSGDFDCDNSYGGWYVHQLSSSAVCLLLAICATRTTGFLYGLF